MGLVITSLVSGNGTLRDNLSDAMQIVPLGKSGYFGEKSPRKGARKHIRVHECSNPLRAAFEFFTRLSNGYVARKQLGDGKGYVVTMKDGATLTFRIFSSSDGSPAVDIGVSNLERVKKQKIHFINHKGGKR